MDTDRRAWARRACHNLVVLCEISWEEELRRLPRHPPPLPPELPPEDDPLSPIGDPEEDGEGATLMSCGSCCNTLYASVVSTAWYVEENYPSIPGYFEIHVRPYCASLPAPSSVTVQYTLSGTATPSADYSGPLVSGSVQIELTQGVGSASLAYYAVDDNLFESLETVFVTIATSEGYQREPFAYQAGGWVYDNEPTVDIQLVQNGSEDPDPEDPSHPTPAKFRVTRTGTGPWNNPYHQAVTVYLEAPDGDATVSR